MLNPNSFENISVILRSLGQRAKIAKYSPLISEAESRKWVFIENDGGILNPVSKLIFNVYRCLGCNDPHKKINRCLTDINRCLIDISQF